MIISFYYQYVQHHFENKQLLTVVIIPSYDLLLKITTFKCTVPATEVKSPRGRTITCWFLPCIYSVALQAKAPNSSMIKM